MSKRESIAGDIITKLDAVSSPIELKLIKREPFEPEELSNAQFPAAYVQTGDETREMLSLGDVGTGKRQGTIDFLIVGFVKGTTANIDTLRNQLIEVIEETLDADITRNGNALNTQVIEANTDEGVLFPYGGIRIVVRVLYEFVRGTA
ncbi:putative mu-like protein [uncultured Mediterranean phage uvMED]|jgi:hypothetical protein|nr:putative mu-like protein [uncultured Mediterranean phage uvMED]|tara:strand:+ start:4410 stop:4853 length:444 start_codon:yes stop_codon:yes gene_type:complete